MRRFSTTLAIAISTLLSVAICSAQQTATTSVPNLIRYSGTLKDAQGAALSSSTAVGVTFSIYKQQDGGASVWMETQNVTPDSNGQYNVILGSTTTTGLPDDLFSQQEQRWLGVQVQGQDEQARVLLVSVPYAFKAHEADTLGGLPASAFVKAPSAGMADGTSVNALSNVANAGSISNTTGTDGKLPPPPRGPCIVTPGYITYWDNTGALCASSLFQIIGGTFNGNIGIGPGFSTKHPPSEPLDVNGVISTYRWYDINEQPFVSTGFPVPNSPNSGNVFLGWGAGYVYPAPGGVPPANVGTNNTFAGWQAGTINTGSYNTFTGSQSGLNNTADGNSFFGYLTGLRNTTGNQNAFFGSYAGLSNKTGHANTLLGSGAGYEHIDGDQNTFAGTSAGFNDYHGKANTFIGASSGQTNGSGMSNTYVGVGAGLWAFGNSNTFLGTNAGGGVLSASNGNFNTFTGVAAGAANTSGSYNTSYGYQAGIFNANGKSNVYLANFGANESNTIRIGMRGVNNQQQNFVYFDPILQHPTGLLTTYGMVTIDNISGQLGFQAIPSGGGGNVVGTCSLGANFLTKWTSATGNVDCSHVYENPTNFFVGVNLPTLNNPLAALDVNGGASSAINTTDTRQSYMIGLHPVLSIFPYANGSLFVGADTGSGGLFNTFVGEKAGTTAVVNSRTFVGAGAGFSSTSVFSTFVGAQAGENSTGQSNDFFGVNTGVSNTGSNNSFFGSAAGAHNTGNFNVFVGESAGINHNVGGSGNTFVGANSGVFNTSGANDIFIGFNSGFNIVTGINDIDIGNQGFATDNGVTRIGSAQTSAYMAGLVNPPVGTNYTVCWAPATQQLFYASMFTSCMPSSRRFKEQVSDMGDRSSKLLQLRPVSFVYKPGYDDGSHQLQYGLIAEEVAQVYPEMVAYEGDGTPNNVKYQLLAPMLLNELQKQHKVVAAQQDELQTQLQQIKAQQQQMQAQRHEIDGLKLQLQQQNALLQERLTRLESYVATQMKTASDNPPPMTATANGGVQ